MGLIRNRGSLDYEPEGEYVTAKRVKKMADVLEDGEQVMYMTKGDTIDVEGAGSGKSVFGSDRSRKNSLRGNIRTAITDRRIVIKIPQMLSDDQRVIAYHNIIGADLDTGIVNKRLSIQTSGPTYHIQVGAPEKKEAREIPTWINNKVEGMRQSAGQPAIDPTEQLQRLKELHDEGVVSDEEFDEKREKLLGQI